MFIPILFLFATLISCQPKKGISTGASGTELGFKPSKQAQKTDSGLMYSVIQEGSQTENPAHNATVTVHYTGWTTDGVIFDSSIQRGTPATFGLQQVIAGWQEGVQLMTKGEKTRFWIPEELAYKGRPGTPQGMLIFDIELLDFTNPPKPPVDTRTPAADSIQTDTGLHYRITEKSDSTEFPQANATVTVHYSGWTSDGIMFDSSIERGTPATFPLDQVIPGWSEGLQLMTVGDKAIFWIPQELGYKGKAGAPEGMLVFEVELLSFNNPPETPEYLDAAPLDALKTNSGLQYKIIKKGNSINSPTADSIVTVHYNGWTSDGTLIDSSVMRDKPATIPLNSVIVGWTEGLQLMSVGDTYLFWIPEELAFKGRPGTPQGMLVFEIQLLEIEEN